MTDEEDKSATPATADLNGEQNRTVAEAVRDTEGAKAAMARKTEDHIRALAREEIKKWHDEGPKLFQPKTWGRRTLAGAIAGSVAAILSGLYTFSNVDAEDISAQFHSAVGTKQQVRETIKGFAQAGSTAENPIFQLIDKTMRQAPVLAFHGEQTFGRSFELELPDQECLLRRREEAQNLSSDEFKDLPLPQGGEALEDVEHLCAIRGLIDFGLDLDIPFHARFFQGEGDVPPHRAWLVVFIRRTDAKDDRALADEVDAQRRPPGLCILYKPASPAAGIESLAITDIERTGNGFWIADLTQSLIDAGVWARRPNNPDATTSLHSLVIEGVLSFDADADTSPECTGVTPVEDQIISVSAMILVNKKAYE